MAKPVIVTGLDVGSTSVKTTNVVSTDVITTKRRRVWFDHCLENAIERLRDYYLIVRLLSTFKLSLR